MNCYNDTRKCINCKIKKPAAAFIGTREFCRLCWHDLTPEEKEDHKLVAKSIYVYNKNQEQAAKQKAERHLLKNRKGITLIESFDND
jgi:hypothetical protein